MSHAVVCWGCGLERRVSARHPMNPMDRAGPRGWRVVEIVAPERWWTLKFLVCSDRCMSLFEAAIKPLRRHIADVHHRKDAQIRSPMGVGVQDAEIVEDSDDDEPFDTENEDP